MISFTENIDMTADSSGDIRHDTGSSGIFQASTLFDMEFKP
ncbi:hypothetical protein HAPAU_31000 [Halalkalicoccus paucihalophilus]|uniref:Uncharacterized protein n=1 Tax=Halalkalicoccus paucihalophilus TaxID=1008153 RepID=A0A151AAU7_9EURY|nr:hypothetical protein HAPAU_31000 [Halalkalicoccus paucihalophilus]